MAAVDLPAIIKARIDADPGLVGPGGILTGLVWTQPFRRDKTEAVFPNDTNYAPAARITDGIDQADFFGIEGTIPGSMDVFPEVRFLAEAHASGKQAIRNAAERIKQLFDRHYQPVAGHAPLFFSVIGMTPPEDSEDFKGAVQATLTLQVKTRWTTVSSY